MKSMIYFLAVLMLSTTITSNEMETEKLKLENKGIFLFKDFTN